MARIGSPSRKGRLWRYSVPVPMRIEASSPGERSSASRRTATSNSRSTAEAAEVVRPPSLGSPSGSISTRRFQEIAEDRLAGASLRHRLVGQAQSVEEDVLGQGEQVLGDGVVASVDK